MTCNFASVDPLVLMRSTKNLNQDSKERKNKEKKFTPLRITRMDKLKQPTTRRTCTGSGIEYMSPVSSVAFARQTIQWKYEFMMRHTRPFSVE